MADTPDNGIYGPDPKEKLGWRAWTLFFLVLLVAIVMALPPSKPKHASIAALNNCPAGCVALAPTPPTPTAPAKFMPADYREDFCGPEDAIDANFTERNLVSFDANPTVGCFAGTFSVPKRWHEYHITKSQKKGDWMAMWCDGRPKPSVVHPWYEDFSDDDFRNCKAFYLQGKGSVTFTRTTTWY